MSLDVDRTTKLLGAVTAFLAMIGGGIRRQTSSGSLRNRSLNGQQIILALPTDQPTASLLWLLPVRRSETIVL